MLEITISLTPSSIWYAKIEGRSEYGRGASREEAIFDLVYNHLNLFGIKKIESKAFTAHPSSPTEPLRDGYVKGSR